MEKKAETICFMPKMYTISRFQFESQGDNILLLLQSDQWIGTLYCVTWHELGISFVCNDFVVAEFMSWILQIADKIEPVTGKRPLWYPTAYCSLSVEEKKEFQKKWTKNTCQNFPEIIAVYSYEPNSTNSLVDPWSVWCIVYGVIKNDGNAPVND